MIECRPGEPVTRSPSACAAARRRRSGAARWVDQVAVAWCHDGGQTAAFRVIREGSPTTARLSDLRERTRADPATPTRPPWQCGRALVSSDSAPGAGLPAPPRVRQPAVAFQPTGPAPRVFTSAWYSHHTRPRASVTSAGPVTAPWPSPAARRSPVGAAAGLEASPSPLQVRVRQRAGGRVRLGQDGDRPCHLLA
jgi:hypothetical protein